MANSDIFNLNWNGDLNTTNMNNVCDLLLQLLDGKKFTIVTIEENRPQHHPHIQTKQELSLDKSTGKKISSWVSLQGNIAGIQISGNYDIGFFTEFKGLIDPSVIFYGDYVTITYTDRSGNIYHRSYIPEG